MGMPTIVLRRITQTTGSTLGVLMSRNLSMPLMTLELPYRGNKKRVSSIPAGTYDWMRWHSPTFERDVIRLSDTAARTDILIHPANYHSELLGCIAPGLRYADWKGKGYGVASSNDALDLLLAAVPAFGTITIVDNFISTMKVE